jgi:putative tricarboxylic transport membrane protein
MGKVQITYGAIMALVSAIFFAATLRFPASSGGINPRAFPLVVILSTFALSLLLIAQGIVKMVREKGAVDKTMPRGATARKLVVLVGAVLLYAALLERVGYILVTPFLMALAMYFFGERKPIRIIAGALITTAALYLIFRGIFRVPLPRSFIW